MKKENKVNVKSRTKFFKKLSALFVAFSLSVGTIASATTISFTDNDLDGLLNKVTTLEADSSGYLKFGLSGTSNSAADNMYSNTTMSNLIKESMLHISFDYITPNSDVKGMRFEMRFDGEKSAITKGNVNSYVSGWQYDENATIAPDVSHHFEAVVNMPALLKKHYELNNADRSSACYMYIAGLGKNSSLSNIKIRPWNTSGTNLGLNSTNVQEDTSVTDRPEGYTGKIYHLTDVALVKNAVRIVNESAYTFAAGKTYNVEFWYKVPEATTNARYFSLVNKSSNHEYVTITDLGKKAQWNKATFTFTPESNLSGTYGNFQKTSTDSGDVYFTELTVLPQVPTTNTVVTDAEEIMVKNGEEINVEGYFTPQDTLTFTKDGGTATVSAAKKSSETTTDFAGYTKAVYSIEADGTFSSPGDYTAKVTDLWGVERSISVFFSKYSDEQRTLSTKRAEWTQICNTQTTSTQKLEVSSSGYNKIEGLSEIANYLNSNCAVFKVDFDIAISEPVTDDSTTNVTLRTGNDSGYTVLQVNNSDLGTEPIHYSYIDNQSLTPRYHILTASVRDLLSTADNDGCIRSYPDDNLFGSWDLWCRKYVMLGLEYYMEICTDSELKDEITECLKVQADCVAEFFENGKGRKRITEFGAYRGINSSSILEAYVRLYEICGEEKYLEFSKYIVDCGGTSVGNIFEFAYKNELSPYQYPITKAYEMISCFEGLLRLYVLENDEKHKTTLINFANAVMETDFTIIGGSSCTHEFFDHSTVRQANPGYGKSMQETCVTVTLMKFLTKMSEVFGNSKYADAFECSMYNAYLGSFNTERIPNEKALARFPDAVIEPLPFDSYSPATPGVRGVNIGGLKVMPDNHYYGCCACIGSVGIGMFHKMTCMDFDEGLVLNLYSAGKVNAFTPSGKSLSLSIDTEYPKYGEVKITLGLSESEDFTLRLRNPSWSDKTIISVNGCEIDVTDGYNDIKRLWQDGDTVDISFDMSFKVLHPIPYGKDMLFTNVYGGVKDYTSHFIDHEDENAKNHIAVKRGPLVMAIDNRLGRDVTKPVPVKLDGGAVCGEISDDCVAPYKNIIEVKLKAEDGSLYMTDYASAGKGWNDETAVAAWFLVK